jgi:TolB-like protein
VRESKVFLVPFAAFALLSAPLQLSAEADQQAKIIVLDLVNGTELDEARLEVLGDAIVSSLAGAKVEVLSAADLRKTLEFKAEQSALGCQQQSCILDLAKVLQARYILSGSLASFKGQFILNLKLIDTKNGNLKVLLRETHEAEAGALTALARISAAKMRQALGGPPPSDAEMAVLKAWAWGQRPWRALASPLRFRLYPPPKQRYSKPMIVFWVHFMPPWRGATRCRLVGCLAVLRWPSVLLLMPGWGAGRCVL